MVLMHLLQQVPPRYYSSTQREQELNHDPSFWSRSWVPTRLLNRKNGSFMLFPLNGSSMMWVWKEWNSMLRKLNCNERTADSRCWADLLPLLHYMGLFSALQLRPSHGSHNTPPQLWAGKWNNCKGVVHSSWNKLHKLWKMKAKAEL